MKSVWRWQRRLCLAGRFATALPREALWLWGGSRHMSQDCSLQQILLLVNSLRSHVFLAHSQTPPSTVWENKSKIWPTIFESVNPWWSNSEKIKWKGGKKNYQWVQAIIIMKHSLRQTLPFPIYFLKKRLIFFYQKQSTNATSTKYVRSLKKTPKYYDPNKHKKSKWAK